MTTVLIVEDEPLIRLISAEILGDAGYRVLEADGAGQALEVLQRDGDIDLLFTDIRMPGLMDGLKLAETVHERWPAVHLLVTSGHIRLSDNDLPDAGTFLPKPYRSQDLIDRVAWIFRH
ncbi:MAG: response regulator [Sphingobium sp.]